MRFLRRSSQVSANAVDVEIDDGGLAILGEEEFAIAAGIHKEVVYIVGLVLSVIAVLDIIKKPISLVGKIVTSIIALATSWIGLAVYFLYAKDHLTEWFK